MFYTTLSEDGFCYIPSVIVYDQANISESDYKPMCPTAIQPINRELVAHLLERGPVRFAHKTVQEAFDFALEIYKKMPRNRRQLGYCTDPENTEFVTYMGMTSRGAGCWKSEVSDKYR